MLQNVLIEAVLGVSGHQATISSHTELSRLTGSSRVGSQVLVLIFALTLLVLCSCIQLGCLRAAGGYQICSHLLSLGVVSLTIRRCKRGLLGISVARFLGWL